jgi:small subunit ribosomal protein S8
MDPIGDLLTRIRNAYLARTQEITVPFSGIKADILKILKKNKYIAESEVVEVTPNKKQLKIVLNNVRETLSVPTFRRISTPGQRVYLGAKDIKKSRNG